jgi:hypothetical protein
MQTNHSDRRKPVLERKQIGIVIFDYELRNREKRRFAFVLDVQKANPFSNAPGREGSATEMLNRYLSKRSLLQNIDQRLLREWPIQRQYNRIGQNASGNDDCAPTPEAAVLR